MINVIEVESIKYNIKNEEIKFKKLILTDRIVCIDGFEKCTVIYLDSGHKCVVDEPYENVKQKFLNIK